MEYLGDKLHSVTGEALGQARRKWIQRPDDKEDGVQTVPSHSAIPMEQSRLRPMYSPNPLAQGIQFGGGDSYSSRRSASQMAPPTIGFRTDLLLNQTQDSNQYSGQQVAISPAPQPAPTDQDARLDVSSESLYQGDTWSRVWFQRVMVLCLLRLLLFIRKVYEDFQATKTYNITGQRGHFLIAATTLFMPTIMFTIYRVARYLQLTLPSFRANKSAEVSPQNEASPSQLASGDVSASRTTKREVSSRKSNNNDDDDAQLRRALMSSPDQSAGLATPVPGNEDGGLVTARQTPTDEFHDSKSQQESILESAQVQETDATPPRPPPRRLNGDQQQQEAAVKLESVNVDKLGDLPDRNTVRVFIGASEHLLHGVLFIFWQLKRQVDVMGYLVERACLWRKPAEREKDELNRLNCHRDGLEWFQDFYAAFLAILAQVYTLGLHWASSDSNLDHVKQLSASQLNAATSGLASSSEAASDSTSGSQSARVVSSLLGLQAALAGKDALIMSELIVSSAVVFSLLICVRRRDDGPLTLGLSMLGWGSLFAARIIIIALAFVHIGWLVMLPLVVLHVLAITGWIYSIALDSHNGRASELQDEAKWDEEAALEQQQQQQQKPTDGIELNLQSDGGALPQAGLGTDATTGSSLVRQANQDNSTVTSSWSPLEHVVLLAQILGLFAIPSLFYWPIMFNLKLHLRPFKYLVLVLMQNFLLIPGVWFAIGAANVEPTLGQLYLLGAVGALSIVGFIFVSLYIACKPSLTEYFARADELFNEAEKCGIYFEFCSRVFKMPDLSRGTFKRLMEQSEQVEEIPEVEETSLPERPQDLETEQVQVNNAQATTNRTL